MFLLRQMLFTYVFARRLEKNNRPLLYKALSVMGFFVLGAGGAALTNVDRSSIDINVSRGGQVFSTVVFCSFIMLLMVLWVLYFYNVQVSEAVYTSILAYLAEHAEYSVAIIIESFIRGERGVPWEIGQWLFLIFFAVFMDQFFAKRIIQEHHYLVQTAETALFFLISALIVMFMSAIATEYSYERFHGTYAFIFCIFALATQTERQRALLLQKQSEMREHLFLSQNARFESYKENVELVNRKCHDLKHQVEAIRQMNDDRSKDKALKEIEASVLIYDSFIHTGNEMLDTILTQKNHICMEKGILFTCVVDGKLLESMGPVDLYTLFGNLLDNSIEAVSRVPEEKRSISLSVYLKNGVIVIKEENPFSSVRQSKGKFLTTKNDRSSHGFGMSSMEMVAEKYGGTLEAVADKDIFRTTIVLPEI